MRIPEKLFFSEKKDILKDKVIEIVSIYLYHWMINTTMETIDKKIVKEEYNNNVKFQNRVDSMSYALLEDIAHIIYD